MVEAKLGQEDRRFPWPLRTEHSHLVKTRCRIGQAKYLHSFASAEANVEEVVLHELIELRHGHCCRRLWLLWSLIRRSQVAQCNFLTHSRTAAFATPRRRSKRVSSRGEGRPKLACKCHGAPNLSRYLRSKCRKRKIGGEPGHGDEGLLLGQHRAGNRTQRAAPPG